MLERYIKRTFFSCRRLDVPVCPMDAKGLTNVVPEIPSWTYPPIRICPFLETKKQGLLDEEMRAIFLAHQERHPTVHIYTDGLSPPKAWALPQCFLTPPVVADLPERLQYSQQNCTQ